MLFLIGLCVLFALCVFATLFLVTRVVKNVYEKRFKRNVNKHLNVLPRKKEPPPPVEEPSILSFALLERFYQQQHPPQLMLPSYKIKQTEAYIQSLPPTYDEIDLNSSSPPPAYIITDLEVIMEEDEHKIQHV